MTNHNLGCDCQQCLLAQVGPAKKKTIRVRIAVAVNNAEEWYAFAGSDCNPGQCEREVTQNIASDGITAVVWIEADVPVPESQTIEGKVMP